MLHVLAEPQFGPVLQPSAQRQRPSSAKHVPPFAVQAAWLSTVQSVPVLHAAQAHCAVRTSHAPKPLHSTPCAALGQQSVALTRHAAGVTRKERRPVSGSCTTRFAPQQAASRGHTSARPVLETCSLPTSSRAVVSLTQAAHAAALIGGGTSDALLGMGNGMADAELLAAAGLPPLSAGAAGAVTNSVDGNRAALLVAFALTAAAEAAALPPAPPGAAFDALPAHGGGILYSTDAAALLLAPGCTRAGGSATLGASGARQQAAYSAAYGALRTNASAAWPVVLPANPFACPDATAGGAAAAAAQHGLDNTIKAVLACAWSLANASSAAVPWSPDAAFIQHAAALDAADGLAAVASAYAAAAESRLIAVHVASSLFFAAYLALVAASYFALLRPYIDHIQAETSRVAALLAFLPRTVDLEKLMALHAAMLKSKPSASAAMRSPTLRRR